MNWNWLQSLVFGVISGFSEFLPVSADAHQLLFSYATGSGDELYGFRFMCHIGAAAALVFSCRPQIGRLLRERRLSAVPKRRRKRQPDRTALLDLRIMRVLLIPLLLSFVLYSPALGLGDQPWLIALLLILNGIVLFLPQFFRSGDKNAQSMSAMDSVLIGLGGALAVLPGVSRMGTLISVGRLRGCDSRYAVDLALLASLPAMLVLIAFDLYFIFFGSGVLALKWFIVYVLSAAASFISAYFGILLMRFLAVKVGFSGFSYFCWGLGLLVFILYLTI